MAYTRLFWYYKVGFYKIHIFSPFVLHSVVVNAVRNGNDSDFAVFYKWNPQKTWVIFLSLWKKNYRTHGHPKKILSVNIVSERCTLNENILFDQLVYEVKLCCSFYKSLLGPYSINIDMKFFYLCFTVFQLFLQDHVVCNNMSSFRKPPKAIFSRWRIDSPE